MKFRIKRYIKRNDLSSAIRVEIPEKGVMEVFFFSKVELGQSTYRIIKSTRYQFNEKNYRLILGDLFDPNFNEWGREVIRYNIHDELDRYRRRKK